MHGKTRVRGKSLALETREPVTGRVMDELSRTATIKPDSCRRRRRPKAGGLSLFWTARHYTILCFRHNLSRQIAINSSERSGKSLWLSAANAFRDALIVARRPHRRSSRSPSGGSGICVDAPSGHQECSQVAVNNRMDATCSFRIPAITVASGPMAVKIRKRRASLAIYPRTRRPKHGAWNTTPGTAPGSRRQHIARHVLRVGTAAARCHE
jgi:hypothetical protein